MTPHLEQRLAQIIEENGYGMEIQHAMRLVVSLMDLEMADQFRESAASEKWHKEIAEGALLSVQAENEALRSRVAELEAICENVPEGCTPADAKALREANHRLIDDFFNTLQKLKAEDDERDALRSRVAELESQLPEGMKHCTILFRECEKGHGRLTAKNWVQHGCPTCERDQLRAEIGSLKQQRDEHSSAVEEIYSQLCEIAAAPRQAVEPVYSCTHELDDLLLELLRESEES